MATSLISFSKKKEMRIQRNHSYDEMKQATGPYLSFKSPLDAFVPESSQQLFRKLSNNFYLNIKRTANINDSMLVHV